MRKQNRFTARLARNRAEIDQVWTNIADRRFLSPAFYGQYTVVPKLLQRYAHGRVIDLGCGIMPFRELLAAQTTLYHGLDIGLTSPHMALIGDVQNLGMFADSSYDVAICLEVFEHLPEPQQALAELARILRPGSILILSVPHLSRIHEAPHDYYRFTEYALHYLLKSQGFTVLELERRGGLFSFLGHQLSSLLLTVTWRLPLLGKLAWFVNKWLITLGCYQLDQQLDRSGVFALGYVVVARKN